MTAPPLASGGTGEKRTGRPTREAAEQLRDQILEVATTLMLSHGYGATSIDEIARQARISKRTFYHRFRDKPALMTALVIRLIDNLRPPRDVPLVTGNGLEEMLVNLATLILQATLSTRALQLHRLIVAEAERFPELAEAVARAGGREEAETLITDLLLQHRPDGNLSKAKARFAAQHFLQMVVSQPQLHALGLGKLMTPPELATWVRQTVTLFLKGFHQLSH